MGSPIQASPYSTSLSPRPLGLPRGDCSSYPFARGVSSWPRPCTCRTLCGGGSPATAAVGLGRVERPGVRSAEGALLSARPPGEHVLRRAQKTQAGAPLAGCEPAQTCLVAPGAAATASALARLPGAGPSPAETAPRSLPSTVRTGSRGVLGLMVFSPVPRGQEPLPVGECSVTNGGATTPPSSPQS